MNKKGLSGVITTLIIVLLVIVAIGVVWVVIKPFITSTTEQFDLGTKCLEADVEIVSAQCNSGLTDCDVVLKRGSGDEELAGVKVIFYNADESSSYVNAGHVGDIEVLETATVSDINLATAWPGETPSIVRVAPYFTDASGAEQLCNEAGDQAVNIAS